MPPILICPLDRLPLRSRFSSSFPPSIPLSSLWVTRRSSGELPPLPSTCLQPFASSVCRPSKHPPTSSPGSTAKPSPPKHATPSPTVSRRASPNPITCARSANSSTKSFSSLTTRCSPRFVILPWTSTSSPSPLVPPPPPLCFMQNLPRKQVCEFTHSFSSWLV